MTPQQDFIQRFSSIFRQVAALASVVIAAIPQDNLPTAARGVLGGLGAILLAVEHYVSDPSTGTTNAPAAPVAPKPPAPPAPPAAQ